MMEDYLIFQEVKLYWTLIGEGIFPKTISRDISIALLCKIIDERRIFDGYFRAIKSSNIFIANEIYEIMNKSCHAQIPVDAISQRILRFKTGKIEHQNFIDLNNIIVEYRSILNKNCTVDYPMLCELYYNKLLKNEKYISNVQSKKRVNLENLYKIKNDNISNNYGSNVNYDGDINYDKNNYSNYDNNSDYIFETYFKNIKKHIFIDNHDTYFDMFIELQNLISGLIFEKKVLHSDICVVVPSISESFIDSVCKAFGDLNIRIDFVSINKRIGRSDVGRFILSLLSIKHDCEHLINSQDKLAVLKIFNKDKNFFEIKNNINTLFSDVRNEILNINIENDVEFIKYMYKKYFVVDEMGIRIVEKVSKILKEIFEHSFFENYEFVLNFIKEYISIFTSKKRMNENICMDSVIFTDIKKLIDLDISRKYWIFFDTTSSMYDTKIETSLTTELAFLNDDILSNINDENIMEFYSDFEEHILDLKIKDCIRKCIYTNIGNNINNSIYNNRIDNYTDNDIDNNKVDNNTDNGIDKNSDNSSYSNIDSKMELYILSSDSSMAGFLQENKFYNKFTSMIK